MSEADYVTGGPDRIAKYPSARLYLQQLGHTCKWWAAWWGLMAALESQGGHPDIAYERAKRAAHLARQ